MTKSVPETEETVEVNGESYALNDHVYLSAPWNASDGAPWLIGRIMEFIRESVPTGPPKKKKTRSIIQLKLAHYHRQRDLLSRHIIDCRLLAASMTYDTFCISRLRGKCRVEFKGDRTPEEVEGWKATPNCFYFSQVYGRYTHRHYDLILTQNLKNAPPEVIQFLRTNYSYIFTEPGMGPELSEERRGCVTCQKWTSGSDSVTCDLCNGAYHFACLNPPLIRKPERGYRWACAPCSKKRQESLDDHTIALSKALSDQCGSSTVITGLTPGGGGRALRDKGKKKEAPVTTLVQSGTGSNGVLRTVDGWPFRYYGQYTQPTTVLDPMDSPYLYTAPRIGIRFQTTVLEDVSINHDSNMRSPHRAAGRPVKSEKRSRDGTPLALPMISDEEEFVRGGNDTIEVISTPEQLGGYNESEFDNYMSQVSQLPLFKQAGVSLLDKALKNLKEKPSFDDSLAELRELSGKSLGFLNWSESESNRMDSAISQLGDDIRGMLKLFPKKTWVDLTKHYYMFKGHKFPETSALETRLSASVSHLPDENLAILPTPSSKRPYICVVCEIRTSPAWRRCPDALISGASLAKKCICHECHLRWRKYGLQHVPVAEQEDYRGRERKSRGPSIKNPKVPALKAPVPPPVSSTLTFTPSLTTSTTPPSTTIQTNFTSLVELSPPSPPTQPQKPATPLVTFTPQIPGPCVLCKLIEPIGQLARCSNCTIACHIGCIGVEEGADLGNWQCLVCRSIDSKTFSKVLCCSLCQAKPRFFEPDEPLTALDVWKLSEYNSFVHMLCAIWHVELSINASVDMSKIEGIASIPLSKRKKECVLCNTAGVGACTKCEQCSTYVHVSCAWSAGYKFGFEMLPQRKRRPRESDLVTFGDRTGLMETRIWCTDHLPGTERATHYISDLDPQTHMTALQTYIRHRKQIGANPNFEILRKARRLDGVLDSVTKPKAVSNPSIWAKALDLEDGYMVSAISRMPESPPIESPPNGVETNVPARMRKSSEVGAPNLKKNTIPRTRVRNRSKTRPRRSHGSLGASNSRALSKIIIKTGLSNGDLEGNVKAEDTSKTESEINVKDASDDSVEKVPVTIPASMDDVKSQVIVPASEPRKPRQVIALVELEKVDLISRAHIEEQDKLVSAKIPPLGNEKIDVIRVVKPSSSKRSHKSNNTQHDQEAPASKRLASKSSRLALAQSGAHQSEVIPELGSVNYEGSSKVTGQAFIDSTLKHRENLPVNSKLSKPPSKLRLTIKPTLPPPPPALHLIEVETPASRLVEKPLRPTHPKITPPISLVESEKQFQKRASKPPRPNPPPPPPLPTASSIESDRPFQDQSLPLPSAPTFAFLPSANLGHHQISHPARPVSSSSSSSTPPHKPMLTRLPSINHLDAFNPSLSRLHSLPHVSSQISTPVYLPPITSVAPRRRSPSIGLLPTSMPPIRHPSPVSAHMSQPPSHFRFAAPLSNPPSFDAFARGASATSNTSTVHVNASTGHTHTSLSPVPAHSTINHSPTPPRQNILT